MNKTLRLIMVPAIAGIVAFAITFVFVQAVVYQRYLFQKEQRGRELSHAAESVKERIEAALSEAHAAVNTISVSTSQTGLNNGFDSIAKKILEITKSVDGLGLVEGETYTHFYPIKNNENVIGHNVFKDTLRNKELLKTLEIEDLYFAGPYQLVQGGTGIVGRLPIYKAGKYYGFATVLIKLSTFLKAAGLDSTRDSHYIYQLSKINANSGKEEFFLPQSENFDKEAAVIEKIPQGDWVIYASLSKFKISDTIWLSLLIGLILSVIAAAIGSYLAKQPDKLQKMLNEKLNLLRKGEEKYTSLFQQALDPIIVVDYKGNFLEANESFCRLLEYTKDELLRMNMAELVDKDELLNKPIDHRIDPVSDPVIKERRFISKSGNVVELEVSRKKIDENHILGIARDVTHLKKVQKQIALSEATLRTAFEHSAIGMAMLSVEGKYLQVNIALSQMTGYSRAEFKNMSLSDITYTEDQNADSNYLVQLVKGEIETVKIEKRYICKNQSVIWVNVNASVIKDTEGLPLFLISQIENITEKKTAELEIQKLTRLYHFISEANESLLRVDNQQELFEQSCRIAVDLGGVTMAWVGLTNEDKSVTAVASYGHEDGYLNSTDMTTDENATMGKGPTGRAIRNKVYSFCNDIANDPLMLPWRNQALQRKYYSSISYPILVAGKVKAVFSMYVSEVNYFNEKEIKLLQELVDNIAFTLDKIELKSLRKKVKDELAESEEKFRTLVEQSMVGVYILQDEKYVYVNPGFEKISGYTKEELIGRMSFEDLIHETDIETIRENYDSGVSGEKITAQYLLRFIHGSGEVKHIEIILSTILFKNKPAIIGTAVDVTGRIEEGKRIEQAIIDAQEKERLQIGMELHDNVKQMIGAAVMQLDILKNHLTETTTALGIIDTLKKYNTEAVHELRRLSHQLAPSLDATQSLAEKISALATNMNINNRLTIQINVDSVADGLNKKTQLAFYRIIQEQLTNIVKYANALRVSINVTSTAQHIILTIADDGVGFDATTKKEGIGLENIRRRAGLLDGKAKIESFAGKGCSVIVEIPHVPE